MLEYELWGNTLESWGISILIIVGAVVVVKLISLFSTCCSVRASIPSTAGL